MYRIIEQFKILTRTEKRKINSLNSMKAGVRGNWGLRIMNLHSALKSMPVLCCWPRISLQLRRGKGTRDVDDPKIVGCVLALIWYSLSNIYLLSGEYYNIEGEAKAKKKTEGIGRCELYGKCKYIPVARYNSSSF